jgi:hypothetical protein
VALDGTAIDARGGGSTVQLEHVTAIGGGAAGVGINVVSSAGVDETLDAVNTITRGSAYDVQAYAKPWGTADGAGIDDVATITMRYSNYRGGDRANEATSDPAWPNARINGFDHNIPDDPKFASATDYHLAGGSMSIDAGRSSGLLGTLELDGFQRTFGAKPDIGAYEWRPAPPAPDDNSGDTTGTDNGNGNGTQQPGQPDVPKQPEQPKPPVDPQAQPGLAIARQSVTVKKNVAAVKVSCPAAATGGCNGTLALTSGKVKVGSAGYSLAAGKRAVVKVKLSSAARKLIARKRKLNATATAAAQSTAKITLKLPAGRR